jgi:hypothetical protein
VQADARGDEHGEPFRRREPGEVVLLLQFGGRRRAGAEQERLTAARLHPRVVVDERQQPDAEPDREQGREPEEAAVVPAVERVLDRLDGVREDVPEEEEEDPGRDAASIERTFGRDVAHPRDRQADEDRAAGDRAEEKGLVQCSFWCKGHLTDAGT